jgi:hypothetical protein
LKQESLANTTKNTSYYDKEQLKEKLEKFKINLPDKISKEKYLQYRNTIYYEFNQQKLNYKKGFLQLVKEQKLGEV